MSRPRFAGARLITKKKKEEVSPDAMIIFGLKFKDHLGNPWFLPTDDGGFITNLKCVATKEEFDTGLRLYVSNK